MVHFAVWSNDMVTITTSATSFQDYLEYHRESLLLAEEKHAFGRERIVWAIEKHTKDTEMIVKGRDIRRRELELRLVHYDAGVKFSHKKILETVVKSHLRGQTDSLQ
jgi:hypothetical protein